MSTAYKGRHAGGAHRAQAVGSSTGKAPASRPWLTHALRRPLASAVAILAVAGVSAAGSSEATQPPSRSFAASPMAAAQGAELSRNRDDTNTALASARRSGVQRASALTQQQKAAAQEAARAREEAARELIRARIAAAEKVARDKVRQGLLDRARSDPKAVGRLLAADRGWDGEQFSCLDSLWTKESGWQWNADNPGSSAYGIPQSLPGSKMASAGSDWNTNPATQITWGLGYISNRYGTPCSAWAHSQAVDWY